MVYFRSGLLIKKCVFHTHSSWLCLMFYMYYSFEQYAGKYKTILLYFQLEQWLYLNISLTHNKKYCIWVNKWSFDHIKQ